MRLADFILQEMEDILVEWEAFAKTLYPAKCGMTPAGLRDHAKEILRAVALDLKTEQSPETQDRKSKGLVNPPSDAPETAAQTHAVLRAQSGMDINELASEYRALRASVLRLWSEDGALDGGSLQDIIRFNEAIDQALSESIVFYSAQVGRSRDLLLGMLGHDMRNPLNAIALTAEHLSGLNAGEEVSEAALCLIDSGSAMKALLDDLVDFSRRNLGLGISIEVGATDLAELCVNELRQHRAAYPSHQFELSLEGDLKGYWDGLRLLQVLRNLLSNACAYGTPGEPVHVLVTGDWEGVRIDVRNTGTPMDEVRAQNLFEPLQRGTERDPLRNVKGLGLGLFIVKEIVTAHGGEVALKTQGAETTISVRLPRISRTPA